MREREQDSFSRTHAWWLNIGKQWHVVVCSRERHQLLFDEETSEPIVLFNGVTTGEGDYVFTASQPIRSSKSRLEAH